MRKYIITRLIFVIITFFIIVSFMYISLSMVNMRIWQRMKFFESLPHVLPQYVTYIKNIILHWDWGLNERGRSVWDELVMRAPVTLRINIFSFMIYLPLGILLGITAALHKNKKADYIIGFFTLIFTSLPSFIVIFAITIIFGYRLNILPPMYPIGETGLRSFLGLFIPFMSLSIGPIAHFTRLVRGEFSEIFDSDYFLLLRTKGLTKKQAIFRHGFKNSIIPILSEIPNTFILVMTGSFFVERVYNIPGVSRLFFNAMLRPVFDATYILVDVHMIVMVGSFYAFLTIMTSFFVDISYAFLDPRMRMGSKKTGT